MSDSKIEFNSDSDYECEEERMRIFGKTFVKNNRDKCKIIINKKEYQLKENIDDYDITYHDFVNIKLIGTNNIKDMSGMFEDCKILSTFSDISNWNTSNVTNMSRMFSGCRLLSTPPDISKWNTSNVTDMSGMFEDWRILSTLPDISNWNTSNVTNMSRMFKENSEEQFTK